MVKPGWKWIVKQLVGTAAFAEISTDKYKSTDVQCNTQVSEHTLDQDFKELFGGLFDKLFGGLLGELLGTLRIIQVFFIHYFYFGFILNLLAIASTFDLVYSCPRKMLAFFMLREL